MFDMKVYCDEHDEHCDEDCDKHEQAKNIVSTG
jgi:hypothetical protein